MIYTPNKMPNITEKTPNIDTNGQLLLQSKDLHDTGTVMDRIWAETKKQMPIHAEESSFDIPTVIGTRVLLAAELEIQAIQE